MHVVRPELEYVGDVLPVGRQLADEVVVADVEAAVTTTGQRDRGHQSRLVNTSIAAATVHSTCRPVTEHRRHPARSLTQVDVGAVALV